jgi:heme/copper-type cytochrome/quinol oxidase subunit 2
MTPLVGIVIASLAALLAPNVRALLGSVLIPMVAATAVQTWNLGSGRGSNPASTIDGVGYWLVQLLIISIVTGLAYGLFQRRVRRAERHGRSVVRPAFAGRRGAEVLVAGTVAMTGALIVAALGVDSLHAHHGQGAGNIPWTGVLGMAIGLVALIALRVLVIRDRNADRAHSHA